MLALRRLVVFVFIFLFSFIVWFFYEEPSNNSTIQFFPINQKIVFTDLGSDLQIYQKNSKFVVTADTWSKTSEKVYLRQNVILLFENGYLVNLDFPWKQNTDWLITKIEFDLNKDALLTLLSFHHAEIHDDDIITSKQAITSDKKYVFYNKNSWEIFKEPQSEEQRLQKMKLDAAYKKQRELLLEQAIRELNINKSNYEIFDLDVFSLSSKPSKYISEEQMERVIGGIWEGLYRSYILEYYNKLNQYSPPMPWILVDRNKTHLLVVFQLPNGTFEKLIMDI